MDMNFSIRQSDKAVTCSCALCGEPVRWAPGPRLCIEQDAPAIVCRECGRTHAPELEALIDAIEAYPGERRDLEQKRGECLDLVLSMVILKHGDPASLSFLRAMAELHNELPEPKIARAIEAALRSNPDAENNVRIMRNPTSNLAR